MAGTRRTTFADLFLIMATFLLDVRVSPQIRSQLLPVSAAPTFA